LAHSCGLTPTSAPCRPADLLPRFDLSRLPREPWVFREEMLMLFGQPHSPDTKH
jgi:hypothetical protein